MTGAMYQKVYIYEENIFGFEQVELNIHYYVK